ncbi:hypothetical protein D1BOALGB6SA_3574 [Olavius sp. associated proteobacterium Delta 1]|nr:hypothetical protein D1BOALGB6SA_3574 [Olavius sp. associated proteobacterium Delta 1]
MNQSSEWNGLKLETPATYRIRVQGLLDATWSDRLAGMAISRIKTEQKAPVMMLAGHLIDQAALAGVLNALYNLHLPLLSMENLDEKQRTLKRISPAGIECALTTLIVQSMWRT